ncbi:hypothetical protein EG329_011804 [Mollisiaceae sp. DMI_Dod_QoI]|nr:hypothetical protein EG329_011804 [Helotiales sp. DMI_Dod_QoI]
MVRQICSSMDLSKGSVNSSHIEFNTAEVLRRIRSVSGRGSEGSISETDVTVSSNAGPIAVSHDSINPFADAPLLNLFRDAMLIQDVNTQQQSVTTAPHDHRLLSCVRTFRTLQPDSKNLRAILTATESYWLIWQDGLGLNITSEPHLLGSVGSGERFILDSIGSDNPALVAKAILFLALCIQQLSHDIVREQLTLSTRPEVLLDSYLMVVDMLLSINENSAPTIDGLECLEITAKLYMNMGKPRESWLSYRRAINLALLIRLHDSGGIAREREQKAWSKLWQGDRFMSMLLGLPAATSDLHPGLLRPDSSLSISARILYEMAVIAGHVSERNQNSASTNYYTTLQIDQQLRDCLQNIPSDWWNARPSESTPIEAVYGLQVTKIHYYMLQKILHQPYMLKSFVDDDYKPSSIATCDASREMIAAYQTLRNHAGMELIICDLMDFQVFTAAIALIIKILSSTSSCLNSNERDWQLVQSVTSGLGKVAQAMECSVASQAAQILEYLTAAHHGTYSGPSQFEAVIPYFGKVKINRLQPGNLVPGTTPTDYQLDSPLQFPSTIDFAANSFAPFSWNETQDFLSGAELGVDWTSMMDDGISYDWNQHFEYTNLGEGAVGDRGTFLAI